MPYCLIKFIKRRRANYMFRHRDLVGRIIIRQPSNVGFMRILQMQE